jgi:hypothetical protein
MQRWESESMKQSYWTNVAKYETSYGTARQTNGQGHNGDGSGGENWSMMGDAESERF